ncbi:MAG TPA: PDZ domain-containing protein [Gemmatimonadaceae bacterium]|nr:PDZ domain-containing protein [Gemmatimonadaceae bacterium]
MNRTNFPLVLAAATAAAIMSVADAAVAQRADRAPAVAPTVSAPITNVRYAVTFDRTTARSRQLLVSMTFSVSGNDPVLLSVPVWTPGAYEISDYVRKATNLSVTGEGGTPRWDKLDPDTWRVVPNGAKSITLAFTYIADSMDNAMSWASREFAFFNGTNILPFPEGRSTDFTATLTIKTEADWQVATGMTPADAPRTFAAVNYHDLVDMPFFIGSLDLDSVRVGETMFRTVTYPKGIMRGADRDRFRDHLVRMVPPMVAVFGEMPVSSYTTLILFDSTMSGAAALEHQNSHLGIYSPFIVDHEFLPSITAHEIFHLWNVKRMRPADMVPYRYDRPQPTTWLWVSEGITDYYADVVQLRGGVIDSAQFLELVTGKIGEVATAPNVALEDASLSSWIRPVDGTQYIYYPKGSLAGFMLDIMIRDASNNARSLDTVMREVYQTTFRAGNGRGFTAQDWWGAVSRAASGRSFTDFNTRYIDGREPFPWSTILPLAGLRMNVDSIYEPWIGLATNVDSAGVKVMEVEPDGAARSAGVEVGDYLLRVGDIAVSDPDFGTRYRARYARRDGDKVPLVVRRGTEERTLTLPVRNRLRTVETVAFDRNASPKALRIRSGILKGS